MFGLSTEGTTEEQLLELEQKYAGLTPESLLQADIDHQDKERVAVLRIGRLLLSPHDTGELSSWIQCRQYLTGDTSYNNI